MGNLFGKRRHSTPTNPTRRKSPEITEQDKAILQLKLQRDKIQQCVKRHEYQLENEKRVAQELVKAGKKDRALLILKKKRLLENVIERTLKELNTIEQMVSNVETAVVQQKVLEGLKVGNDALKQINQMFSIEDVEKIMDETREAAEYQEEISNLIDNTGATLTEADMDEINAELEALTGAKEKLKFPAVPSEPLPARPAKERGEAEKEKRHRVKVEA